MPFTSIAEVIATETPSKAELALIEACKTGTHLILPVGATEATLPPEGTATPDREIRAKLLRLLIMGGTKECALHPSGVWLNGAQITGTLDLSYTKTHGRSILDYCRFDAKPEFRRSECSFISLEASFLPGLFAQGVKIDGSLILRRLISTGTISLNLAKIGGQLDCSNAVFDGDGGKALNAQSIEIGEILFLRETASKGTINLYGANIGGQLTCISARLDGAGAKALNAQRMVSGETVFLNNIVTKGSVDLTGAKIGGHLNCQGASLDGDEGKALNAHELHVSNGFFFRRVKSVVGQVHLISAHCGNLVDDVNSWPADQNMLALNGFTYDRIGGASPLTIAKRKDWLDRGSRSKSNFHPQPYTQFARVLWEMGHASEARKVLMARDSLLFAESQKTNLAALTAAWFENQGDVGTAALRYYLTRFWAWFSFIASGYGHAPQRALFVSLGCIGIGAVLYFIAWQAGVMVPNSAIILTSPDWLAAMAAYPDAPAAAWAQLAPGTHYETFYSLPYALDVFVPFVSLGQENAWAATTTTGFGKIVRWFTFAYQITGWAITALGIAAITGFVQKNQPD